MYSHWANSFVGCFFYIGIFWQYPLVRNLAVIISLAVLSYDCSDILSILCHASTKQSSWFIPESVSVEIHSTAVTPFCLVIACDLKALGVFIICSIKRDICCLKFWSSSFFSKQEHIYSMFHISPLVIIFASVTLKKNNQSRVSKCSALCTC